MSNPTLHCGPNGHCFNTIGSFNCVCNIRFEINSSGTHCNEANECNHNCKCNNCKCTDLIDNHICQCQSGFEFNDDQTQCIDIDECLSATVCVDGTCANDQGSFHCSSCDAGYELYNSNQGCTDINECTTQTHNCAAGLFCINKKGSFSCSDCDSGFIPNSDYVPGIDVDVDIGADGEGSTEGSGEDTSNDPCIDINECETVNTCGDFGSCINTRGSYTCGCATGYEVLSRVFDGPTCVDANECNQGACANGECYNTDGSFYCECHDGYEINDSQSACVNNIDCICTTEQIEEAYGVPKARCLSEGNDAGLGAIWTVACQDQRNVMYTQMGTDCQLFDVPSCELPSTASLECDCDVQAVKDNYIFGTHNPIAFCSKTGKPGGKHSHWTLACDSNGNGKTERTGSEPRVILYFQV